MARPRWMRVRCCSNKALFLRMHWSVYETTVHYAILYCKSTHFVKVSMRVRYR